MKINTMKSDLSLDELKYWIPVVYDKIKLWHEIGLKCFQVAEGDF